MTLTTMMRMAREGSLATVLAVALIAVPSLAFAGPAPTSGAPHAGTVPLPAVHGTDPGNHGPHGVGSNTPAPLPSGTTTNGTTDPTATSTGAGSSVGMEVMGGALIGLGILMFLLKDNTKAQSIVQTILQALGMSSLLNGSMGSGGIINMLGSLFGALNGGSNPLGGAGSTLGSLGSVIGAAGSIANGNSGSGVGLNAERGSITSGAAVVLIHDAPGGIGLNRNRAR